MSKTFYLKWYVLLTIPNAICMKLLHIQHYFEQLRSSHDTTIWIKNKRKTTANWKKLKKSLTTFLWFFHFFHNAVSITSRKEYNQWSTQKTAYSKAACLLYRNLLHWNSFLDFLQIYFLPSLTQHIITLLAVHNQIFSSSLWHSFSGSMNSSLLY